MGKPAKNYVKFTEEDFVCDPFFQEWVLHTGDDQEEYWERFLQENPEKRKETEAARAFLMGFKEKESPVTDEYVKERARALLERIEEEPGAKRIWLRQPGFKRWLQVAVFTGIVLSGVFLYRLVNDGRRGEQLSFITENGKIKTLLLPDSSSIVLNANSEITYDKKWNKTDEREIWMKGEAFFSVKHFNNDTSQVRPGDRFIVHTEQLTVSVLGTSFDIRERRGKTEVVLQTGSIKIAFPGNVHSDVVLVPGDHLTYLHAAKKVIKTTVEPEDYSAWKEQVLLLKNPTLEEIVYYLEDTYGKKIIIEDKKLAGRVIEGPIRLNNLENTLFIISTVLNVETIQKDNRIIIRSK